MWPHPMTAVTVMTVLLPGEGTIVICVTIVTMPGVSATKKSRHTQPVCCTTKKVSSNKLCMPTQKIRIGEVPVRKKRHKKLLKKQFYLSVSN